MSSRGSSSVRSSSWSAPCRVFPTVPSAPSATRSSNSSSEDVAGHLRAVGLRERGGPASGMSRTSVRSPASRWRATETHARRMGVRAARRVDGGRADHHGDRGGARRVPQCRHRVRGLADRHRVPANYQGGLCRRGPARSPRRCPSRRCNPRSRRRWTTLAADKPDAILHVGFGLGIPGMNDALREIGWLPPRYTTTAFEFASTSHVVARAARRLDRAGPVRRAQRDGQAVSGPVRSPSRTQAGVLLPGLLLRRRPPDDDRAGQCPPADRAPA